jgi:hypothetical protein
MTGIRKGNISIIARAPPPSCWAVFSGRDGANQEATEARRHGRKNPCSGYSIRIWKVERAFGF